MMMVGRMEASRKRRRDEDEDDVGGGVDVGVEKYVPAVKEEEEEARAAQPRPQGPEASEKGALLLCRSERDGERRVRRRARPRHPPRASWTGHGRPTRPRPPALSAARSPDCRRDETGGHAL